MTVQELMDELSKIEDKTVEITNVDLDYYEFPVVTVSKDCSVYYPENQWFINGR